jgi:hypothetical protein
VVSVLVLARSPQAARAHGKKTSGKNAPMVGKGGFMGMAMPWSSTKKPPTMSEMWRLWFAVVL